MMVDNSKAEKLITTKRNLLRLRYIGNTCGIIEREIPEEITYEKEGS
jgi:hypothetical protein